MMKKVRKDQSSKTNRDDIQVTVRANTRQDHLLTEAIRHKGQNKLDIQTKY